MTMYPRLLVNSEKLKYPTKIGNNAQFVDALPLRACSRILVPSIFLHLAMPGICALKSNLFATSQHVDADAIKHLT